MMIPEISDSGTYQMSCNAVVLGTVTVVLGAGGARSHVFDLDDEIPLDDRFAIQDRLTYEVTGNTQAVSGGGYAPIDEPITVEAL